MGDINPEMQSIYLILLAQGGLFYREFHNVFRDYKNLL
jgi:hypothetical protein